MTKNIISTKHRQTDNNLEIIIDYRNGRTSYGFLQGYATKFLMKNFSYRLAESHGLVRTDSEAPNHRVVFMYKIFE